MRESLRSTGWEGPLGWPDINPSEKDNFNVEDYVYTRTLKEATAISFDSDTDVIAKWWNDEELEDREAVLVMLHARYSVDELWEKLTAATTLFASTYMSEQKLNLETSTDYENAMADLLQIQLYISTMKDLYEKMLKNKDLISELETSTRNYVSLSDAKDSNGEIKPEYASVYDSWTAENSTESITTSGGTEGVWGSLFGAISKLVKELSGEGTDDQKKNRMTTQESSDFLLKYSAWADSVSDQLVSLKNKTGIDGEAFSYSATFPRSVKLGDRQSNMNKFKSDVELIDSLCMDVNARSVWVFLQIGNIKFSTWDKSNYIVNFDYKKNGSGTANSFTFDLAYNPPPGDTDINKLEKIISKRKVFFQFGYNELDSVCSPQYTGQILSYTVSVENNFIKYSIVGYSEAAEARFGKIEIPDYGTRLADTVDEDGNKKQGAVAYGIKATDYAKQVLELYLASYGYKVVIAENAANADQKTVIEGCNCGLFEAVDHILAQAVLTDEIAALVNESDKSSSNDTNKTSEVVEETSDLDASNTQNYFTFTIDDNVGEDDKKTITILRIASKNELEKSDIIPSVAFAWGGDFNGEKATIYSSNTNITSYTDEQQDALNDFYSNSAYQQTYSKGSMKMLSNVVQSFTTSYQGEVTLSRAYQEATDNLRFNKRGELVNVHAGGVKYATGDTSITDEKYSYWLWERNTMFSYNATLTLVGIPSDIPIGTYLYVKPMVNGVEHHTAGFYYVTGSEDKVTSSGYTTTINLIRIIDKSADETLSRINSLRKEVKYRNTVRKELSTEGAITEKIAYKRWEKEQKNKK